MDDQARKTALRMIPYGIYVLTAGDKDGDIAAATVNWVTQTSFSPPLVALGVKTDSGAYAIAREKGQLVLNVLGQGQQAAAFTFFKPAEYADGKLSGAVKVASIKVKDENLAAHLLAPDFFDGEQYPTISFASDALNIDGDDLTLEGELTLKGVTKPVRATGKVQGPTEDFMGNQRLGFTLDATIDRTAYGVDWNADLPKGGKALGNDVTLAVELEFIKA